MIKISKWFSKWNLYQQIAKQSIIIVISYDSLIVDEEAQTCKSENDENDSAKNILGPGKSCQNDKRI